MPLVLSATLGLSWIRALRHPFFVSVFGMVMVGAIVVTGQILGRAPSMPGVAGVLNIWASLLPEMLGIMIPVAGLFASVTAAHRWVVGGEMCALASSGVTVRSLLPANFLLGVVLALGVGLCTHALGPMGRANIRNVLSAAVSDLAPVSGGPPVELDSVWVKNDGTHTVVASERWVAWAASAQWSEGPLVDLQGGQVTELDGEWTLRFDSATITLGSQAIPPHNFERGYADLWSRIDTMEGQGEDASRERLTVYKRTMLAFMAPLMLLLGLPLGAMLRKPSVVTLGVVLGLWTMQRIGDHAAFTVGPSGAALLPLVVASCVTWLLWVRWRAA